MNATISFNDKQGRMLLILILIALAAGALVYFYTRAQKKQPLATSGPDAPGQPEQRLHQHLAHIGHGLAAGMTRMEQSINGRLDELEHNTRPQLAIAAANTQREPIGFRPPYMDSNTTD